MKNNFIKLIHKFIHLNKLKDYLVQIFKNNNNKILKMMPKSMIKINNNYKCKMYNKNKKFNKNKVLNKINI